MNRVSIYIAAVAAVAALLLSACGVTRNTTAYIDDMYGTHDRVAIAERQKAIAEAERAEAEARQAQYEAMVAKAKANDAQQSYEGYKTGNSYTSVLADSYESAYARRLYAFSSPTYRAPSSYYTYQYTDAFHYASAYDPAFYNIMVAGDMVWVEPKYITSMFGTWGAAPVPSYGWYYGWSRPYRYSWWSPYHSWLDLYWGMGFYGMYGYYDPFWGWGHPHHYGPHPGGGHHHHKPPHNPPHHSTVRRTPAWSSPSGRGGAPSSTTDRAGGAVRPSGQYGRPSSINRGGTTSRPSGGQTTRPSGGQSTYRGGATKSGTTSSTTRNTYKPSSSSSNSFHRSPSSSHGAVSVGSGFSGSSGSSFSRSSSPIT